jgi:biopolymer transport protein TolR
MRLSSRKVVFAEINVTPFVDVMLVLLIIFMVAAPLLDQGIPVVLPKAVTGQRGPRSGMAITLSREHVIYFNGQPITPQELREQLAGLESQPVLIRADKNAYVSRLVALWDLCRESGFREIHIATLSE